MPEDAIHYLNESHIFLFLLQVALLLGLSRVFGLIFERRGLPAVTAEVLVGIFLGPTILGRFAPDVQKAIFPAEPFQQNMLQTVAWLGILFFLLLTGLETDFAAAWKQRKAAFVIAVADLTIPMVIAFVPCMFLPAGYLADPDQRVMFCLFVAAIMTISALPVTARALMDLRIYKTDPGLLIMCALTINDLAGWLVFALILGFVTHGKMELVPVVRIVVGTALFALFTLTLGRKLVDRGIRAIEGRDLPGPGTTLSLVCVLAMVSGAITLKIGIHALFGFFLAGVMVGECKLLPERTAHVIADMVRAILVPLFFATIGLKVDFLADFDIPLVALILVIGVAGRFVGAWLGVALTRRSRANRLLIAIAHTPGGEMQIVVGLLALEYGVITTTVYVAVVFAALVSSVVLGPWIRWTLNLAKAPPLLSFLSPRAIVADLAATSRQGAIGEMSAVAARRRRVPGGRGAIAAAVLEREQLKGTGLEHGIAIPHARLGSLSRPVVAVGVSPKGVEWDSPDGKPARLIFLVLTPVGRDDAQLRIMRGIATAMSDGALRAAVLAAGEQHRLWAALEAAFASDRRLGT